MSADTRVFVAWEERIISQERGSREVHFYLKDICGDYVLAVVGTERSIRHMMYVASDEFLQSYYGAKESRRKPFKWRARREAVGWLTKLVAKHSDTGEIGAGQALESLRFSMSEFDVSETLLEAPVISKKLTAHATSNIDWSGTAWLCSKQLKHYSAFCRNGATIRVHSFVFVMAEKGTNNIGYVEDLYEDKKGQKKVKARWFHHKKQVEKILSHLNSHPQEVFITPHVQVVSAECIDGPVAVLTPDHFEKCLAVVPQTFLSKVYMCSRQFKNNGVFPCTLTKLHGYSNQVILSYLEHAVFSKHRCLDMDGLDEGHRDMPRRDALSAKSRKRCTSVHCGGRAPGSGNPTSNSERTRRNLKFKILRRPSGSKLVTSQPEHPLSFRVNDEIELLCQDSGIRGCWFRCKILRTCQKHLKVQYKDVQSADGSGYLEEWVPASRVAFTDKLGLRCSGRLTTRPRPIVESCSHKFEVGAPVDAWWSDGWWEGIVCGVNMPSDDRVQVYIPSEEMFLMLQRENIRTSRDWLTNRWVDIKMKPELLSSICATVNPCKSLSVFSTMVKASSSEQLDHKAFTTAKLEGADEGKPELQGSNTSKDTLEAEQKIHLGKRCRSEDEKDKDGGVDEGSSHNEASDTDTDMDIDDDGNEKSSDENYDNNVDGDLDDSVMEDDELDVAHRRSEVDCDISNSVAEDCLDDATDKSIAAEGDKCTLMWCDSGQECR